MIIVKNATTARKAIKRCSEKGYSLDEGEGEIFNYDTNWGWCLADLNAIRREDNASPSEGHTPMAYYRTR